VDHHRAGDRAAHGGHSRRARHREHASSPVGPGHDDQGGLLHERASRRPREPARHGAVPARTDLDRPAVAAAPAIPRARHAGTPHAPTSRLREPPRVRVRGVRARPDPDHRVADRARALQPPEARRARRDRRRVDACDVTSDTARMPYAEGRTYYDADSHLMELSGWLAGYADPDVRDEIPPLALRGARELPAQTGRAAEGPRGAPAPAPP